MKINIFKNVYLEAGLNEIPNFYIIGASYLHTQHRWSLEINLIIWYIRLKNRLPFPESWL